MGVSDGQTGNASTLNAAFMARNADTSTTGAVNLDSSATSDGTAITSAQQEHNSIASFVGKALNTAKDAVPSWASDIIGVAGDTVKARVEAIVAKFRDTAAHGGHTHSGADGQGPLIALSSISATGTPGATNYLRGDGQWAATSGGGQGGVNFLNYDASYDDSVTDSSDFDAAIGNWVAYADAAASSPVDMTGGTPTTTFTRSTTTPLNGTAHGLLTKDAANRQGEGASCVAYIPPAYRTSRIYYEFPYKVLSGTYALDDTQVFVYDVTNSQVITPFRQSKIYGTQGVAFGYFDIQSTTAQIRFGLHVASTSASAYTLAIDDVKVTPVSRSFSAPVGDWISKTVTGSWTGSVTYSAFERRIGDTAEYYVEITGSGAPTGTTLQINLPSGRSIDTAKLPSTGTENIFGIADITDVGTSEYATGRIRYSSTTAVEVIYSTTASGANPVNIPASVVTTTSPFSFGSGDKIRARFSVPISGWSSNVQMADSTIVYAYNSATADSDDTSSFVSGSDGVAIGSYTTATRTKRVRFARSIGSADHVFLELQVNGQWIKAAEYLLGYTRQGTNDYGIQVVPVTSSTTDYDVKFSIGGARPSNATYAGAGEAWSTYTGVKWRLVAGANAVSVGVESCRSSVVLDTDAGAGSTNTKNRNFTNITTSGTALTGAVSATNAASVTVNEDGLYGILWNGPRFTSNDTLQVTKNAVGFITMYSANVLAHADNGTTGNHVQLVVPPVFLPAGTVLRFATFTASLTSTAPGAQFVRITKVNL